MAAQVLRSHGHFDQYSSIYDPAVAGRSIDSEMFSVFDDSLSSQPYAVHPSVLHSNESSRRASLSPQQTRMVPRRQRTPIQRQREDSPRSRSHSRSEALMTYVADQLHGQAFDMPSQQQPSLGVVPSQSAPSTPQILPGQSAFSGVQGPAQLPYTTVADYFPGSLPTQLHPLPEFGFQPDSTYQDYYPLSRNTSIAGPMAGMNIQEAYLPPDVQHAPDGFPPGPDQMPLLPSTLASSGADFEIMPARPKPQCWDHGCNGRQFSTFSNLLRHQREKSGSAMKAICPYCGTEFTRTTARNGHMYGGKCKGRSDREGSTASDSGGEKDR